MPRTPAARFEFDQVADDASRRIVGALATLPLHIAPRVWSALYGSDSNILSHIGEAMATSDPVAELAGRWWLSWLIGDGQDIYPLLGDEEPWGTIKAALRDIDEAWHAPGVGYMTRADHRRRAETWDRG